MDKTSIERAEKEEDEEEIIMKIMHRSPEASPDGQKNFTCHQHNSIVGQEHTRQSLSTDDEENHKERQYQELKLPELPKSLRKEKVATTLEFMVMHMISI